MVKEKRKESRNNVEDGVLYLHETLALGKTARNGLAFDVSDSGACIYTQQVFREGDSLKVFCTRFGDTPIKSTVRWCQKVDDRLYKVGVIFSGDMP